MSDRLIALVIVGPVDSIVLLFVIALTTRESFGVSWGESIKNAFIALVSYVFVVFVVHEVIGIVLGAVGAAIGAD